MLPGRYLDISEERPDVEAMGENELDNTRCQKRKKITGKRPPRPPGDAAPPGQIPRTHSASSRHQEIFFVEETNDRWDKIPDNAFSIDEQSFWTPTGAAVEIPFDIPTSKMGQDIAFRDLGAFFTSQLERQTMELSERRLSDKERTEFAGAKMKEVKNYIIAKAFEAIPKHLHPTRQQAMCVRWILTWKAIEGEAKARAVILGYLDPDYENRPTASPTMTRITRQLFLQFAAWPRMRVGKETSVALSFKAETLTAKSTARLYRKYTRKWECPKPARHWKRPKQFSLKNKQNAKQHTTQSTQIIQQTKTKSQHK
jgi:hypothetical protein